MLSNINNVCRLCMTHENVLLPIFWNADSGQLVLCTKIMSFAAIKISEHDGLPSQICQQCVIEVNRSYNFKKQCENTDATLRQCFMALHSSTEVYQKMDDKEARINDSANQSTFSKQRTFNIESQKLIENQGLIKPQGTDTHYNLGVVVSEDRGNAIMEVETLGNLEHGNVPQQSSSDDETMIILEPAETVKLNIPLTQVITVNDKRFHQCLICSKRFGHKSHLTDNVRIHTLEKVYHCTVSNKSYSQKSSFAYHQAIHHKGGKPHVCSYCDKSFLHKSHLINHMRLLTGEKPYSCKKCGKAFSLHSSLKSHLNHHMGTKLYICTVCNKTYSKRSSLAYHLGLHKPQKFHECTFCNKKFTHKSHLKVHIRIHTGEKPYSCRECGKCFSFRSSLASHLLHHTGEMSYSCQICSKMYSRPSSLSYHMGLHKEEKPYPCSFCEKLFCHKLHLANQTRHSGEKPFLCNMCGQAFPAQSRFYAHFKRLQGLKEIRTKVS